jgi:hypothetical protein
MTRPEPGSEPSVLPAEDSADLGFALVAALAGTPEQLQRLRAARDGRVRATWARFALRAAGEALQRSDPVRLRLALAAAALAATDDAPDADLTIAFAPLHHAATAIGVDRVAVFDDAARLADPGVAAVLRAFGRRDDVELAAFGWRRNDPPRSPVFSRDH